MSARAVKSCQTAVFAVALAAMASASADEPAAVPYRPTVSDPADLPVPHWLEAEFGGLRTFGADRSRGDAAPWLLKYAFDENHGLLVGGNAYVVDGAPGAETRRGLGDTVLEYKQRFAVDAATALGVEAGAILPTAPGGLGAGKPVWTINGILSRDLGALRCDVNLGAAHYTRHDAGASAWQQSFAAALSWAFSPRWGGAFEVSGAHRAGTSPQSQALAALDYTLSPRVVLDAGTARGLARGAHDRSVFAGATVLLGRLH